MSARILSCIAVFAMAGCSLIFDGGRHESDADGGQDAGVVLDGSIDGGGAPACDLASGDQCCSWVDCGGTSSGPFCSFGGERWACDFQCHQDSDCHDFPVGHACVTDGANRVCACEDDGDCAGALDGERCLPAPGGGPRTCGCSIHDECTSPEFPLCGMETLGFPTCVGCLGDEHCAAGEACVLSFCETRCMNDGDCESPDRCIDDTCRSCDVDDDGFDAPECMPTGPPDCDDFNPGIRPGAEPLCGTSLHEDCESGRWTPLQGLFGAQEIGVLGTFMSPGALPGATDISVVVPMPGIVLAAALVGGSPRIFRSTGSAVLGTLSPPSAPILECGTLRNVTFDSVHALRLAADDTGKVLLAMAGRSGTENVLALYALDSDDTWRLGSCQPHGGSADALDVAIAPDVAMAAALWPGVAAVDSEVQWMTSTSNGTHMNTQSGPHWLFGSGDIMAGRNVDAGMANVWFMDGGGARLSYQGLGALAAAFTGRSAFSSATPARSDYAHIIGDSTALFLLRGRCSAAVAASCPAPSIVTLDSAWPSAEGALYAGADLAGATMVVAHAGTAPLGGQEIQLSGVPYVGGSTNHSFAPLFGGMEDMGPGVSITVLDVAVDAFRGGDNSEIAVAFLIDDGSMVGLGVRVLRLCDVM